MTVKEKIQEQKATASYEANKNNANLQEEWLKKNKVTAIEGHTSIPKPYSGELMPQPTNIKTVGKGLYLSIEGE